MIKNRVAQIVYYSIYLTIAVFGLLGSLGYFSKSFSTDFYVFYTNLSNYFCMVMIIIQLVKRVKNKTNEATDTAPRIKFISVIMILVTFLVYNILLAKDSSAAEYFLSPGNLIMHLILPILYILDWVLFYTHGKTKWYYPLISTILPLGYVVWIVVRSFILKGATWTTIYPYFFLNIEKLGWGGFFAWVFGLVAIFIAIGYLFVLIDKKCFNAKNNNKKEIKID